MSHWRSASIQLRLRCSNKAVVLELHKEDLALALECHQRRPEVVVIPREEIVLDLQYYYERLLVQMSGMGMVILLVEAWDRA